MAMLNNQRVYFSIAQVSKFQVPATRWSLRYLRKTELRTEPKNAGFRHALKTAYASLGEGFGEIGEISASQVQSLSLQGG